MVLYRISAETKMRKVAALWGCMTLIFFIPFPCWSACGYLCWVWLWILCIIPLIIKAALLIKEKRRPFIALTVLKYEIKVKHWFTFVLVKLFEISIKSASKFLRVGQMKSHKLFSIKKSICLNSFGVVASCRSCWMRAELLCWLLSWEQTGQTRPNPGKNDNQYTACCENNSAEKTDKKKTTYLPEPPLQMNLTFSSLTICTWIVLYEAWLSPFLTPLLSPVPFDVPCCLYKINNDPVKMSRIPLHLDCISWSWVLIKSWLAWC